MRFLALASDYDGALAENGYMTAATRTAVERLRATGRKLILATGRSLDDLAQVLFSLDVFDRIVAENGAILYCPREKRTVRLSPDLPPSLIRELQAKNVEPLWVGEVILATRKENAHVIQHALRRLQLDVEVVVNKQTIMLLPAGINKATGLLAALDDLGISEERVTSVGDGENDTILFEATGCGAAVANATEAVKGSADHVTKGTAGASVKELIDQIIATDLVELRRCVGGRRRHAVAIASGGDSARKSGDLYTSGHAVSRDQDIVGGS